MQDGLRNKTWKCEESQKCSCTAEISYNKLTSLHLPKIIYLCSTLCTN